MKAVINMPTDQYARWLQETTAGMLATAPNGAGIIPAQYRAMADYEPFPTDGQPAGPSTPLSWIRASVEKVKREMAAEQEGRELRRSTRNGIARDFRHAIEHPPPDSYSIALSECGMLPDVWQSDGSCPEPYTIALGELVARRADGTP